VLYAGYWAEQDKKWLHYVEVGRSLCGLSSDGLSRVIFAEPKWKLRYCVECTRRLDKRLAKDTKPTEGGQMMLPLGG
jgi:hypothetical protein